MKTLNACFKLAPVGAAVLTLMLSVGATAQTAPPAPSSAASAAAPAPRPAPLPGALSPFAEVTREAKRVDGYLPVWTRDDRTWLEIPATLLDKPFFMASSIASGMGEGRFWPGLTGRSDMVVLRRVGNTVQLVSRNTGVRAPEGTPLARAVEESYSDSLLAAAPLAAAPHAQSKALLVDATVLLGGDLIGAQTSLEQQYRVAYALDRANSSFERVRPTAAGTYFTLRQHFAVPRLPALPPPGATPPNPAALPSPPTTVPDARSLFVSIAYTLAPLPAEPLALRAADPRVGYFTRGFTNFGNDNSEGRKEHVIRRWRLEKKDPAAAVSEPKEPIRVVMDRNIPEKWREPMRNGILEWNKAFERAGFRNAIVVEQQPADADWSSLEGTRMLSVRWFAQEGPGATAVGPSQSDPRTGEMLRGAAIIPENWVRIYRARAGETVPRFAAPIALPAGLADDACTYAQDALEDGSFAFALLAERGEIDPNGPDAERFIAGALKDVVMHEVGHALGLRHNFRASVGITATQLRDPAFTAANGVSNSVMDYNASNVPLDGERVADYHMATLGAYDYWAIEYGYRQYANAAEEKAALAALAARAEKEPALAYASDEDVGGIDPLINQRDLGNDPLAFAQRQLKLGRELWDRVAKRELKADDDLTLYRRTLSRVLTNFSTAMPMAMRYMGGTHTTRAMAGARQPLLVPVPAAQQRAALELVVNEVFSSQSFRFDPAVMARLGVDQFDRSGANRSGDFSLPDAVATLQRTALDTLMSDALAGRLASAESKVKDAATLIDYAEVQDRLSKAVWSELAAKGKALEIDSLRRNLQREHVRRLAGGVLRPSAQAADVRAVHRMAAQQLLARLQTALAQAKPGSLLRAHLEDSASTLNEALKAPLAKQGV